MKKPLLQLALDTMSLEEALRSLQGVDKVVDIIECGTILLCAEGARAVGIIRTLYPDKPLVADFKIADSGSTISGILLEGEPDYLTCICSAHINTMKAVTQEIEKRGLSTKVQIELYGDWTFEQVEQWKSIGIRQVILHHSRDIKGGWSPEEIRLARKLCDLGMEVTVTGSLAYEDLELFRGIPIFCIICGRSIRDAENPVQEAQKMQDKLTEIFTED